MDSLLEFRYGFLFDTFDASRESTAIVKRRLLDERQRLRPDAALSLLVLFDQMIVKPYEGDIALANGQFLPPPDVGHDFRGRIVAGLELILRNLKTDGERASSHDVLQSIEYSWPQLSELYGWA